MITKQITQIGGSGFTNSEDAAIYLILMNTDILCEGHFGVYYGRENVSRFIRSFMKGS